MKRDTLESSHASYKMLDGGDRFEISPFEKSRLLPDTQYLNKVIEYSFLDNNIPEIHELNSRKCICQFYSDLKPMVIIEENDFYGKEVFLKASEAYQKFIGDFNNVHSLYNRIVDSHIDFMTYTGCYFSDISSNNILVNSDYSDFKIIDMFSIRAIDMEWENRLMQFDPLSIILCAKFEFLHILHKEDEILKEFLQGVDVVDLIKNSIDKIEKRRVILDKGQVLPF